MNEYLPTKTNLMRLQSAIKLSKQGQNLLERKKMILENEKEKYEERAKKLRQELNILFKDGYEFFKYASMDIGMNKLEKTSQKIEVKDEIDIKYKTIMGVEIPSIIWINKFDMNLENYNLYTTTVSLDKTVVKFNEIKKYIIELAEIENTVKRLEIAIIKVQTRSNALQNIIIPEQQNIANKIANSLEEKEREEFARLKVIKKRG